MGALAELAAKVDELQVPNDEINQLRQDFQKMQSHVNDFKASYESKVDTLQEQVQQQKETAANDLMHTEQRLSQVTASIGARVVSFEPALEQLRDSFQSQCAQM